MALLPAPWLSPLAAAECRRAAPRLAPVFDEYERDPNHHLTGLSRAIGAAMKPEGAH
jgi:hypothetical protein